jgi:hypothetical protein
VRVNVDYHIEIDKHYYSVPYALLHRQLDARFTVMTVEIFHQGERVPINTKSNTFRAPALKTEVLVSMNADKLSVRLVTLANEEGPTTVEDSSFPELSAFQPNRTALIRFQDCSVGQRSHW